MNFRRYISLLVFPLIGNFLFTLTKVEEHSLLLNKQGTFKVIDWGFLIQVWDK